ncbi:MAG: hypothetical protein WA964_10555 [Ilumatobacter sp.]|uniref:hypothetical protein n=1 Tax=Ilumatobacter sp. TaxID=1967498 RepID=UPI003C728F83
MSSISLNDRKTSVMRRAQSQRVLGVLVDDRLNVARRDVDRLLASFDQIDRTR